MLLTPALLHGLLLILSRSASMWFGRQSKIFRGGTTLWALLIRRMGICSNGGQPDRQCHGAACRLPLALLSLARELVARLACLAGRDADTCIDGMHQVVLEIQRAP